MTLLFLTNYINHHQVYLADEFNAILGRNYHLVVCARMPESRTALGYPDFSDRSYLVKAYESTENYKYAIDLINESDVVIVGAAPESMVQHRISCEKLTFRYNERWFKSRPWFLHGPRWWLNLYRKHIKYRDKPLYMLCASAYTARDVNQVGAYVNKCFKWGYFTNVGDINEEQYQSRSALNSKTRIMWCARFLRFKHPELPIKLAARLKQKGYIFQIDMFGTGDELETTKKLAKRLNVEDVVAFCGSRPNDEILNEMKVHDIFLFTSDRNEGWGAVLNEAMSNGCAVVASNEIGSVPFLIKDGVNGLVFKSKDIDSLERKVTFLLDNPQKRLEFSKNAVATMQQDWSPKCAARRFVELATSLLNCEVKEFSDGPCSKAYP